MSATTEQNARLLIRNLNARNVEIVLAQYAEDASFQDPSMSIPIRGKDAIRAHLKGSFGAFPDWRMVVSKLIISGGETIVVNSVQGTHTGPWSRSDGGQTAPTNRKFTQEQLTRVMFNATDKIQSFRAYGNPADVTRQLGISA
jgi:ketosteroid isomerase-like protein